MRRIRRLPLPKRAQELLQKRADEVARAADPAAAVEKLWSGGYLSALGFDDVRETLRRMASGVERCMYCEDSHGNSIEHFGPKPTFPTAHSIGRIICGRAANATATKNATNFRVMQPPGNRC